MTHSVDILIIGSGPIGATFAHGLAERMPTAHILMLDAGPQLTSKAGLHVANIADKQARTQAQIRSQGPSQYPYETSSIAERATATHEKGLRRISRLARPGTHLATLDDAELDVSGLPAAALSTNIGGMGAHWTCACPPPGDAERISFIPQAEWNSLFERASALLSVTQSAYSESVAGHAIQSALGEAFDMGLPVGRKVQPMPLACRVDGSGQRHWASSDVVLGSLMNSSRFELRSDTLCRQLLTDGDRITGAQVEHLPTGAQETITARVVIVAADALRTPQLLWASGIRPRALGHYLNDQPQVIAGAEISEALLERSRVALGQSSAMRRETAENVIGTFWVPFHEPTHPFHGQVMHMDLSPIPLNTDQARADAKHFVGLGWFCRKDLRYEDWVEFSDTETDYLGMPKMHMHYALTEKDDATLAEATKAIARAVIAFGATLKPSEPFVLPAGSSLHYQGSTRMSEADDGQSVCDAYSRVWGWQNLFVGGNGVIPTATACNPTATSAALALRACECIAALPLP